jgi:CubicO group peptidase (beta-lactamase class C family)
MKKLFKINFIIFFFISFVWQPSFPQQNKIKLFNNYLEEYIVNKHVPSISAGVLRDDKIIWLGVKGFADLENNAPASENSLYRIASISKSIIAVAIMQLYEKGLIDLDKEARTYIPSFPEKKWKFTVRQLLNHTSGIRNYREGEFHSKNFYSSTSEAIKVFAYDTLMFEPGTKYAYSTLAYSLLASIIENVTKQTFEDYLIKNIFTPAEMHTTFIDKQKEIIPNRVNGYEKNYLRQFVNAPLADLSIKVAGGGLISDSKDLLLFSNALLNGKLIKPTTLDLMLKRTKLKSGTQIDYGLGFSLNFENDSLKSFYHVGGGTGFSTMLLIYPKEKLATIDLINITDINLGLPAKDLAKIELTSDVPYPTKTITDELMLVYREAGIDSSISKYFVILNSDSTQYNLSENELIYFAKDLVGLSKTADAIKFLKTLQKKFTKSFSLQVVLAETYLKDKNEGLSLKYFRNAWQLNKKDAYVNKMILRLTK